MKLNMGWCLGVMGLLPLWAQASYVESCEITGKVLQDSSTRTAYINGPQGEYEVSDLPVSLRIQKCNRMGVLTANVRHLSRAQTCKSTSAQFPVWL